jgi:hypothetical protein
MSFNCLQLIVNISNKNCYIFYSFITTTTATTTTTTTSPSATFVQGSYYHVGFEIFTAVIMENSAFQCRKMCRARNQHCSGRK